MTFISFYLIVHWLDFKQKLVSWYFMQVKARIYARVVNKIINKSYFVVLGGSIRQNHSFNDKQFAILKRTCRLHLPCIWLTGTNEAERDVGFVILSNFFPGLKLAGSEFSFSKPISIPFTSDHIFCLEGGGAKIKTAYTSWVQIKLFKDAVTIRGND